MKRSFLLALLTVGVYLASATVGQQIERPPLVPEQSELEQQRTQYLKRVSELVPKLGPKELTAAMEQLRSLEAQIRLQSLSQQLGQLAADYSDTPAGQAAKRMILAMPRPPSAVAPATSYQPDLPNLRSVVSPPIQHFAPPLLAPPEPQPAPSPGWIAPPNEPPPALPRLSRPGPSRVAPAPTPPPPRDG